MPLLVLLAKVVRPVLPWSAGNAAMASNRLGSATFSISGADNMVVGVGCLNPAEMIRDPVTTSSSKGSPVALASASALGASAAPARPDMTDKANTDTKQRYKSRLALGIS
jgi:hypothetical protein